MSTSNLIISKNSSNIKVPKYCHAQVSLHWITNFLNNRKQCVVVDNQGYPYIWPTHCKDSQKISLKLYSIVTHFVNFKHNFHKEIESFFRNKLKWIQEKCFKMNPLSSELPFHVHNWLIISFKDFCIVIRKWPTFWPSSVVVDGSFSNYADVESGIPQGTVLGPLLFLLHINDLPSCVNSKVRLFADDCLL